MPRARFSITPIKNRGGSLSYRVGGMLSGLQVRVQFKTKAEAVAHVRVLELKVAKSPAQEPRLTWMTHPELTDAEAALTSIRQKYPDQPFTLLKAANYFAENYWIPITQHTVETIKEIYLKAKKAEVGQSQYNNIRGALNRLAKSFPTKKSMSLTRM